MTQLALTLSQKQICPSLAGEAYCRVLRGDDPTFDEFTLALDPPRPLSPLVAQADASQQSFRLAPWLWLTAAAFSVSTGADLGPLVLDLAVLVDAVLASIALLGRHRSSPLTLGRVTAVILLSRTMAFGRLPQFCRVSTGVHPEPTAHAPSMSRCSSTQRAPRDHCGRNRYRCTSLYVRV